MNRIDAKGALDKLISKSRVHLYKPIQIAEILHVARTIGIVNPMDKETYRIKSRDWRDKITTKLVGRVCTSSIRFQDNLFEDNAIPPIVLQCLSDENIKTHGAVEAYIYNSFFQKHIELKNAIDYCTGSNKSTFNLGYFLNMFWVRPGLRRSIDKVYEIIVYALFMSILDVLEVKVQFTIDESKKEILNEFESFTRKVLFIDEDIDKFVQTAKVFRVGVTNAADRGLDMYSNWGPVIQIKHLSLDEELAEEIVDSVSSDKIIIVCKDADQKIIKSLLTQIGWKRKIQSIITENELLDWYQKALTGTFSNYLGDKVLNYINDELNNEFPSVAGMPDDIINRKYNEINDSFWKIDQL